MSFAVCQSRADDLVPCGRVHVGVFVHDHMVEVQAAHPVSVVCAVEPDPSASRIVHPQLALVKLNARDRRREALEILPRHVFSLNEGRRDVSPTGVQVFGPECGVDQVGDSRNSLSGTTMSHDG